MKLTVDESLIARSRLRVTGANTHEFYGLVHKYKGCVYLYNAILGDAGDNSAKLAEYKAKVTDYEIKLRFFGLPKK